MRLARPILFLAYLRRDASSALKYRRQLGWRSSEDPHLAWLSALGLTSCSGPTRLEELPRLADDSSMNRSANAPARPP